MPCEFSHFVRGKDYFILSRHFLNVTFVFIFNILLFLIILWGYVHVSAGAFRPPEAEVMGSCEMLDVGDWNLTQILWKSGVRS